MFGILDVQQYVPARIKFALKPYYRKTSQIACMLSYTLRSAATISVPTARLLRSSISELCGTSSPNSRRPRG